MSKPIGTQRLLGASLLAGLIAIVVNTAMLEAADWIPLVTAREVKPPQSALTGAGGEALSAASISLRPRASAVEALMEKLVSSSVFGSMTSTTVSPVSPGMVSTVKAPSFSGWA
jgi:hypothetical protein